MGFENFRNELEENTHRVRLTKYKYLLICEYCNNILTDDNFVYYGGKGRMNFGVCKNCQNKVPPIVFNQNPKYPDNHGFIHSFNYNPFDRGNL